MPKNIMLVMASGLERLMLECNGFKVIIRGSPVSEKFAQDIQADACASTAPRAWMV